MKKSIRGGDSKSELGKKRRGVILGTIALIIVLVLVSTYGIMDLMERNSHSAAENLVSEVVDHINNKLNEVKDATRSKSLYADKLIDDPDSLERLVRDFVDENSFVYGSTIAFEPDAFPDKGRCFAPYSWKTSDGFVHSRQLGTETDYYEEEWYAETKLKMEEYWCEPYFDEGGAKIMMCTFSVPLKGKDGKLAAVMTADVGLEDLEEYISSISPYPDSYIVLRSAKGSVLANGKMDKANGDGTTIIKGITDIGWSVEMTLPLTYLLRGNTGSFVLIGVLILITVLLVFLVYRLLSKMQERSSAEYLNVIDSISSSYSSIYLVNLITEETVVFRDPEEYSREIVKSGDEGNGFISKLKPMLEYDCFEGDFDRMCDEISPDTIRSNLEKQDRYEVRFRKDKNGSIRWHEMHVFVMEREASSSPSRAIVAFIDIDESVRKEIETQETLEVALETAQSASKAKTDFLFNMSHDIRTPMNAIIGFTNMAKKHIDDREKVLDCLEKTQKSGNLLLALINSVLDVSRIESGHAKLEESAADVELSFTAIEDTLTELAAARDIAISFEIGKITDRYVYCDLDRCNRIFVNIISNAIKYSHEGGRIIIKCEQIECVREGYGLFRYTFEDNGIGMSEEFQKKVFDQFTREKSSTVSGIQGSGLGLAVCKSFVELMNGTIECRSKLGVGTTFTVTLPFRLQKGRKYMDPYSREEVNAAETGMVSVPVFFRDKVGLLVEDNELNREIAEEILEDEGINVDSAEDGSVAVRMMKEKGPDYYDFILMDIQMPTMDGYEATREIRKMYPDLHIPIIALSANAFEEDRKASKEAGMDDHVAKPIEISVLKETLAKYL